jgi:hypothetical protein
VRGDLASRMRATWKRLDATAAEVDPVATMQASTLLAEAAQALDEDDQLLCDVLLHLRSQSRGRDLQLELRIVQTVGER